MVEKCVMCGKYSLTKFGNFLIIVSRAEIATSDWISGITWAVSSIYIWSKNFSHSAYVKSEAKDGGH